MCFDVLQKPNYVTRNPQPTTLKIQSYWCWSQRILLQDAFICRRMLYAEQIPQHLFSVVNGFLVGILVELQGDLQAREQNGQVT